MTSTGKVLTKAEEQVMQSLWKLKKALLRDLVEDILPPKPHQNTVATILKILIDKGFVGKESIKRSHVYFPLVSKESYSKRTIKKVVANYFEGSFSNVVSFMVKQNNLSIKDLELLLKELKK